MSWENRLEGGAVPDSYVDPPFEFDAPRWDPLEPGRESTTDDAWFATRHPLHEGPRAVPKPLLPPDVIAQCAEYRKSKHARTSASVTPVAPPAAAREGSNLSGHTPLKISGRPQRVSSTHSPFAAAAGTPGSLRRRAATRASSGLALCSVRPLQFHSPSESTNENAKDKERSGSSQRSGSGSKPGKRSSAHEDDEDAIARLLAAHNSKIREQDAEGVNSDSDGEVDDCVRRREDSKLPLRALPTNAPAESRLRRPDAKSAFLLRSEHSAPSLFQRAVPAPERTEHATARPAEGSKAIEQGSSLAGQPPKRAAALLSGPARRRRTEDHSRALGFRREADDDDGLDDIKSLLEQHNRNVVAQNSLYDQNGRRRVAPATTAAPKPIGRADPMRMSALRR